MGEKGVDFDGTHFFGMALIMEENETADPEPVRLLGPDGIVVKAHHFPELFAEA